MNVIKIENNKIVEKKQVLNNYLFSESEFEDDGTYGEVGMVLLDGVWRVDPQEIAEQQKQQRIAELKLTITNKKLLDMDCTAEQTELRGLLGL